MNEKFGLYFPVEENLSIDESMIPYYGRHSSKQFIRGKPIRFGFKLWCVNTRLGYLINCYPYQGAGAITHPHLGLGGSGVVKMQESLPPDLPFKLYCDNFFTSLKLRH